MIKAIVIFGAGVYTGVYIAQNYQGAMTDFCKKAKESSDKATKNWLAYFNFFFLDQELHKNIDKVEDPKVLFEKAQAFVKSKLDEFDSGKKGDK